MGYTWLEYSATHIGHRLTGSVQGAAAERLADSLFRVSGLPKVHSARFTANAWSRGTLSITVSSDNGEEHVGAVSLASTPIEAFVDAPLVDAGNGLSADLDALGGDLVDKAVLVNIGMLDAPEGASNLHRSEKAKLAREAGAAAVLFVNNVEGGVLLTGTASVDGRSIDIPAVCVGSEDGARWRSKLAAGQEMGVRMHMTNASAVVTAHNVIAEIPGSVRPEEVIVIGGHLDSWDLASGATDNGLGAFSILDMARCFAASGIRPQRTLRFVLFMGEEQGLLGSGALVEEWRQSGELQRIKCMINMDMTGGPTGFVVVGPDPWSALVRGIEERMVRTDTTFKGELRTEAGLHSDHQPFMLAGVPVLAPISDLGHSVYGCYHSSCDDIHLVEPWRMEANVRVVGMLALGLANAPELPGHFSSRELEQRMIADGLEEKLRIQGEWRW